MTASLGMPGIATRSEAGRMAALRDHLLYLAVIAIYCLPFITLRDLYFRDETRYGGVVKEMMRNDNWSVLTIGNQPYLEKPPLFFTLLRGAAEVTGSVEPWVFFAVVALTAFFFLAASDAFLRALGFARPTARMANLFLLAMPFLAFEMSRLRMDLMFAGFILLSVAAYARGLARREPNLWPLAGGLLAAIAVLVKGPFGALMPLLAVIVYALVARRPRLLIRGDVLVSLGVMALPVAAWFALLYVNFGGNPIDLIVREQLIERAVSGRDAQRAWWLYLVGTPALFMPWLLLTPVLLVSRYRAAIFGGEAATQASQPRPDIRLLLIFLAVSFILLNAVAQKNIPYLLPILPGLAVFLAIAYRRLEAVNQSLFEWLFIGLAFSAAVWPVALIWAMRFLSPADQADLAFFVEPSTLILLAGAFSLCAIPLLVASRLTGGARLLACVASVAIGVTALKAIAVPDLNRAYSPGVATAMFSAALPPDARLVIYGVYRGSLSYHLDVPHIYVSDPSELKVILNPPGPAYVLTTDRRAERDANIFFGFERVAGRRLESTNLVLLRRRAE